MKHPSRSIRITPGAYAILRRMSYVKRRPITRIVDELLADKK